MDGNGRPRILQEGTHDSGSFWVTRIQAKIVKEQRSDTNISFHNQSVLDIGEMAGVVDLESGHQGVPATQITNSRTR